MGIREGSIYKFRLRSGEYVLGYVIDIEKRTVATDTGKLKTLREEEFESWNRIYLEGNMHSAVYMKRKMDILKDVGKFSNQRVQKEWALALEEGKFIGVGDVVLLLDAGLKKYGYNYDIMFHWVHSRVVTLVHFDKGIEFNEKMNRVAAKAIMLGQPIKEYGQYETFDRLLEERLVEVGYFRYFGKNKSDHITEEIIVWEDHFRHQFELSTAIKCTRKGVQDFIDGLEEMISYVRRS